VIFYSQQKLVVTNCKIVLSRAMSDRARVRVRMWRGALDAFFTISSAQSQKGHHQSLGIYARPAYPPWVRMHVYSQLGTCHPRPYPMYHNDCLYRIHAWIALVPFQRFRLMTYRNLRVSFHSIMSCRWRHDPKVRSQGQTCQYFAIGVEACLPPCRNPVKGSGTWFFRSDPK